MNIRLVCVCTALVLGASSAPQNGSSAQQAQRLRLASSTVVVDVVANDRGNRNVTDLRKEELQVFENDVQQEIDSFAPVHGTGTESPRPAVSPGDGVIHASKDALGNLMVLLLDYATVEYTNQDRVRKAAVRYVRESMHPIDVLAVFRVASSFHLVQDFTSDKDKLVAALEKLDATGSKFALDQAQLVADAQGAQNRTQSLISNIESIRANPSAYGPAVALALEMLTRQQEMVERMEARAYAQLSQSREMQARPVLAAIEAIAEALRRYQGRKTLILFTEGFSVGLALEKQLYHAIDLANKSNTAVYAVDGAGLRHKDPNSEGELYDISALKPGDRARASMGISQFDRAREVGSDQPDSTLRFVTSATGGTFVHHTNDLFGALQRIDNDIRSYYVLTYRPSNLVFDGEFRTIKVKTTRPGVSLRFRQGYFALPPGASLIMPDEYSELLRVRNGKLAADASSLSVQPYSFLEQDGRSRVLLSIEFPTALVDSRSVEGGTLLYPKIWGTVSDQSGEVITSFRSPSKISLTREASQGPAEQSISLLNELSLAPGLYSVEVFAETRDKGRPAYETKSLNVQEPAAGLSLSSIVLSNRSTLKGGSKVEHFPSATRTFRNHEKVVFYLHAYNPRLNSERQALLEVQSSIRNDTGSMLAQLDPFTVTQVDETGVPHAVVSRFVQIETLPPGRYQLETHVTDRHSGQTAAAQTSFTVAK